MDTMYQRGKIQEESLYYEHKKHDGSLPLVGVNTRLPKEHADEVATELELIRSTEEEKGQQIDNVRGSQASRNMSAPVGETEHGHIVEDAEGLGVGPEGRAKSRVEGHGTEQGHGLSYLQRAARERHNVFEGLVEA